MYIKFVTKRRLLKRLQAKLEKKFGFEIELEIEDEGDYEYCFGYSQDSVGEDGCCDEDPLPYDEAVRCCGVLELEGIRSFGIEGNGEWAMSMIQSTDFSRYSVDNATKQEWARTAAIFWSEANPDKISEIRPKVEMGCDGGFSSPSESAAARAFTEEMAARRRG